MPLVLLGKSSWGDVALGPPYTANSLINARSATNSSQDYVILGLNSCALFEPSGEPPTRITCYEGSTVGQ